MRQTTLTLTLTLAAGLLLTGGNLWAQEGEVADVADAADTPHLPPDSMEIGAKYTGWFLDGEADSLWAHFTHEQQERRSTDDIRSVMDQVLTVAGIEAEVIEQKYVMRHGMPQFWHTASFTDFEEPLMIRWVITPEGRIDGFGMNPLSQAPEIDPAPAPGAAPAEAPEPAADPSATESP
ncbi:MAG: hypothetical protein V3U67_00080 [Gemmatimonadota bacterium]